MSKSAVEKALDEAGFSRPGSALREIAEAGAAVQEDLFADEPSLLSETIDRVPGKIAGLDYVPPHKKGGRPSGAKGKATRELMQTLDALGYKDPLIAAAEIVSTDYHRLASILGCSRLEAFDRWMACARFLADFKHQKMPVAIDAKGAPILPLSITLGAISAAGEGAPQLLGGFAALEAVEPEKSMACATENPQVGNSEGRTSDANN